MDAMPPAPTPTPAPAPVKKKEKEFKKYYRTEAELDLCRARSELRVHRVKDGRYTASVRRTIVIDADNLKEFEKRRRVVLIKLAVVLHFSRLKLFFSDSELAAIQKEAENFEGQPADAVGIITELCSQLFEKRLQNKKTVYH
jgi:hypothetical protein